MRLLAVVFLIVIFVGCQNISLSSKICSTRANEKRSFYLIFKNETTREVVCNSGYPDFNKRWNEQTRIK